MFHSNGMPAELGVGVARFIESAAAMPARRPHRRERTAVVAHGHHARCHVEHRRRALIARHGGI